MDICKENAYIFRLFLVSPSFSVSFYLHIFRACRPFRAWSWLRLSGGLNFSPFFRVVLLLQASTMQQTTARPLLSLPFSRCYEIGTFGALLVVCCVLVLLSCC